MDEIFFFKKTLVEFEIHLKEHSIETASKFVVVQTKNFNDEKVSPSVNQIIHWKDGTPYYHFGMKMYQCHHGKDMNLYQKKKYAEKRDKMAMMDHSFTKRNDRIQTTKKLDCPASFQVNKVIWMPKFKLSGALSEKYDRFRTSKLIRTKLQNGESVGEDGYIYNLPSIEKHANHFIGDSAIATEDIDSEVREYLSQLVRRGERSAAVVKKLLETFVETQLHQSNRLRRRFFPDLGTIRKIMSYEKAKLSQSPIDQERTELLIESWGGKNGKVFFRPCAREIDVLENESNKENKLLFIYQSEKMRSLYEKYGKSAIFLDATYKTTKYALPLFFIVVDTNVNYQIVGVIITQFETKQAISEGLEIFKSWNPSVNPRYGMVDNAAEEIGSLEATFPGIKVFICSFHREQAWIRWLAKKCNSNVPTNQAIIFLRKIAHAGSEEELKEAIELLESQKFYSESSLKVYFEKTWLKEIQRWATAYKPLDFHINTNNGVERMNKELKYGYLIDFKGCSLSEMIEIVVNKFLPERYRIYVEKNLKISSKQRKYDENLPAYLHEKPKWFIKLVMGKLATITSTAAQKINQTGESSFAVESFTELGKNYKVIFNQQMKCCSCSCKDFMKERIICKHILAIGCKFPDWDIARISGWLFSDPIFNIDNDIKLLQKVVDKEDNNEVIITDGLNTGESSENGERAAEYQELPLRGSDRRHIMNDCNSSWRSLQSMMWNLSDSELKNLSNSLKSLVESTSSKVSVDENSGLPVEAKNNSSLNSQKKRKDYDKLSLRSKKVCSGRVGHHADMLKEATRLNVEDLLPGVVSVKKPRLK